MKIKFFIAWYDCWVGWFYDRQGKILYVCPLPCCVFKIQRKLTMLAVDDSPAPRSIWHNGKWYHMKEFRPDEYSSTVGGRH